MQRLYRSIVLTLIFAGIINVWPISTTKAGIRNWGLLIVTIPITITASGVIIASFFENPQDQKDEKTKAFFKNAPLLVEFKRPSPLGSFKNAPLLGSFKSASPLDNFKSASPLKPPATFQRPSPRDSLLQKQ